jgi:hypothetical protein
VSRLAGYPCPFTGDDRLNTRITSYHLRTSDALTRRDDIVYLPDPMTAGEMASIFDDRSARAVYAELFPDRPLLHNDHHGLVFWLEMAYREQFRYRTQRQEPTWMERMPIAFRRYVRGQMAAFYADEAHYCVLPNFPHTGAPYAIFEGGLTEQTHRLFGLERLQGIRQLAFLHDPLAVDIHEPSIVLSGQLYPHTRYVHSHDVMALATLIGLNVGLTQPELNALRVAALTHDVLTPAGGDMIKLVDPVAFDEDLHYPAFIRDLCLKHSNEWQILRTVYRVDAQLLAETVQGNGTLNALLDIADKIAYVARDAACFAERGREIGPVGDPIGLRIVKSLLERSPYVCDLWDTVELVRDKPVFRDPDRLADFLHLRARLFRHFYYYHGARFLEYTVGKVVVQYLYDQHLITREDLLKHQDHWLETRIAQFLGVEHFWGLQSTTFGQPETHWYPTLAEATAREDELLQQGHCFVLVEALPNRCKPATHWRVRDGRRIRPFREARPEAAAEIERVAELSGAGVYYVREPRITDTMRDLLLAHRIAQRTRSF